jgi:hypothetical protein
VVVDYLCCIAATAGIFQGACQGARGLESATSPVFVHVQAGTARQCEAGLDLSTSGSRMSSAREEIPSLANTLRRW